MRRSRLAALVVLTALCSSLGLAGPGAAGARADELDKARVFQSWAQGFWATPGALPAVDSPQLVCHRPLAVSWTTALAGGLAAHLSGEAAGVSYLDDCRYELARDWWATATDLERCEVVFHEVGHLTGRANHTPHTIMDAGEFLPDDFEPCAQGLARQAGQARLDRLNLRRARLAQQRARPGARHAATARTALRTRRGAR